VLTLGGGIVFTPISTALTVVALRRTRPETLVDFGALLVGAAAVAVAVVLLPVSLPLAVGLGVTDTWIDWRRRVRTANSPAGPGASR